MVAMKRTILAALLLLATTATATPAAAQLEVERRRAAPPGGEVDIDSAFGAVVVKAWDKAEVLVKGTIAAGAEGLDFDGDKEGTSISIDVPESWFHAPGEDAAFRSNLEVWAPAGSRVSVETINATVVVDGFSGLVDVATINGAVQIAGSPEGVEVETMTGRIDVRTAAAPMEITSVSGSVAIAGAAGEVKVETVSGSVDVAGGTLERVEIKTTTGAVSLRAQALSREGGFEIESFSSPVKLLLPKTAKAVFRLQTFGGKIQSAFCAGTPVVRERFEPFRQLRCSTGPDDFEIQVQTHDADITISTE
jgi:hypothetical protein